MCTAAGRHDGVAKVLSTVFDGYELFAVDERDVQRRDVRQRIVFARLEEAPVGARVCFDGDDPAVCADCAGVHDRLDADTGTYVDDRFSERRPIE